MGSGVHFDNEAYRTGNGKPLSVPKTPLASIFAGAQDGQLVWVMRCNFCKNYIAVGDSMEEAGAEFFEHMFFGRDTSEAHYAYARKGATE
jgi:hypothetical protein